MRVYLYVECHPMWRDPSLWFLARESLMLPSWPLVLIVMRKFWRISIYPDRKNFYTLQLFFSVSTKLIKVYAFWYNLNIWVFFFSIYLHFYVIGVEMFLRFFVHITPQLNSFDALVMMTWHFSHYTRCSAWIYRLEWKKKIRINNRFKIA